MVLLRGWSSNTGLGPLGCSRSPAGDNRCLLLFSNLTSLSFGEKGVGGYEGVQVLPMYSIGENHNIS